MRPKRRILTVVVGALIALTGLAMAAEKPNVLFLILDDMNNDLVFLNGSPKPITPNLERLAEQGMVFTRAYCAVPACSPTRAAVLSGLRPSTSGVYENKHSVADAPKLQTCTYLPEHFRENGYWTMVAGKVFHKKPETKKYSKLWNDMEHDGGGYGPSVQPGKGEFPQGVRCWGNSQIWTGPDSDFPDVRNTDAVVKELSRPKDKPFFIACGIYRPHVPYTAPKRFFDLYDRNAIELPPILENDVADLPPAAMAFVNDTAGHRDAANLAIKEGYLKTILHGYLASASFADWNVGRILDALDNGPHAKNTIVVLWGDHGFHHGEKERFTKFALWEKTTNMPMVFRLPGQAEPRILPNPVSQMDLYPTLCELCGLDVPKHVEGKSVVPMFENPEQSLGPAMTTYGKGNHSLRTRKYRYIRYDNGDEEFYVHADDPHEWHNQAGNPEYREIMDELAKQLPASEADPGNVKTAGKKGRKKKKK